MPAVQTGNLLFLSGMLATSGHTATAVGVVGKDRDVKAGREAAYMAALNALALARTQPSKFLTRHGHVRQYSLLHNRRGSGFLLAPPL